MSGTINENTSEKYVPRKGIEKEKPFVKKNVRAARFRFCTIEPTFSGEPTVFFQGGSKNLSGEAMGKIWVGGWGVLENQEI